MKLPLHVRVCLGMFVALTVSAAENVAEYNARVWQSDEGLPVDAAWTGTQTPDGYLWVGTRTGLARFDGTHFTIFDTKNVPGMTDPNITGLRATREGSLWIATGSGGVHRLKNGHFFHYGHAEGLAADHCIGPIFEDEAGAIWIGTVAGLSRFQDGLFKTIYGGIVRGICQDLKTNLWFATTTGIDCWSNGGFVQHWDRNNGLHEQDVRAICCGPRGNIWVGAGDEIWEINHGKLRPFIGRSGINYNLVTALYKDRRGTFWAGTYSGLNRIVDGKFVPELNADGLPYGAVMDIFEDHEGDVWACAKDGLIRLKPNRVLCYTQRQGLANDNVSAVLEDRRGTMCIATWGGGLNWLSNGVISTYTNNTGFPTLALGLGEDRNGDLWIGTDFNRGLFRLKGNSIRHFTEQNGSLIPAVRVIFEDHSSNLWVGTSAGLYQMRSDGLQPFSALMNDVIRAICEDDQGNLWIGMQAGLAREHNGSITRFNSSNGLPADAILDVFEDASHTLWLGTQDTGLVCYRDGKFTTYTSREGLLSDHVTSILEDDRGWLWLGSDRGIFRVNKKNIDEFDHGRVSTLRTVSYGKTDGMVNRICNAVAKPSAWKSRDGRLWFATIKGVCVIDPRRKLFPEPPPPPVVIEELRTEQQTLADPQDGPAPIRLGPGRGELEFRYAALGFRAPEVNRYMFKLEGVDAKWVNADTRQIAHYNNIYPGRYRFHVIACNSDGIWNETGASLAVEVLPHFWQTWWFRPGLLVAAVIGLAILYRVIMLRGREMAQLRLRIAADLHDEIGSNLASIALLSQLGDKSADKAGHSELSEIHRIALLTVNSIREIVWFINPDYDTMPEMILRMKGITSQMLIGLAYTFDAPANAAGGKLSLEIRRNLLLIFKEILHNIVKHSHASQVEISLREAHGVLELRVADNGRGFDTAAVCRGNGLRNMRLRAGQLRGAVEFGRNGHHGAVVLVTVRVT